MTPTPDWIHALWAAVAALFWRLFDSQAKELKDLKKKVEHMDTQVTTHTALHAEQARANVRLEEAVKENTAWSKRMSEAIIRIETLISTSLKKE